MIEEIDSQAVWALAQDRLRSLESGKRLRRDVACNMTLSATTSVECSIGDEQLINFSSNDYLDLARHPDVKQGAIDAVNEFGSGSMASRLVCGTLPIHHELEAALANFKGAESALVFSSGYMACLGIVQALGRRSDDSLVPVIFDRLVHASLIDGATQDRRKWRSFPHNNLDSLELLLQKFPVRDWPTAIVLTEGIFSMDGDMPPLKEMADLCAQYQAILVVDDAHGTGTIGNKGQGSASLAGLAGQPHVIQVGTLSKALGAQGGFVAGPAVLRDLMVNTARTFIYDTGLAPACCGAALAALDVIKREPERLERLHENVIMLKSILATTRCDLDNPSPIIPVLMGDESKALAGAAKLREQGFLVPAIRPPTVPAGTSRLRITISAGHKAHDIRRLGQAITVLESARK